MTKEEVMNTIRTLDHAFSNYMVADMDGARFDMREVPDDAFEQYPELLAEAAYAGRRMAVITLRCNDRGTVRDAANAYQNYIHELNLGQSQVYDYELHDGDVVKTNHAFTALCRLYQLDDHRKVVIDAFCNECFHVLCDCPATR